MTGAELWDKFNEQDEIEVTAREFAKLQEHLLDWLAPGEGFKVERTPSGFHITRW